MIAPAFAVAASIKTLDDKDHEYHLRCQLAVNGSFTFRPTYFRLPHPPPPPTDGCTTASLSRAYGTVLENELLCKKITTRRPSVHNN